MVTRTFGTMVTSGWGMGSGSSTIIGDLGLGGRLEMMVLCFCFVAYTHVLRILSYILTASRLDRVSPRGGILYHLIPSLIYLQETACPSSTWTLGLPPPPSRPNDLEGCTTPVSISFLPSGWFSDPHITLSLTEWWCPRGSSLASAHPAASQPCDYLNADASNLSPAQPSLSCTPGSDAQRPPNLPTWVSHRPFKAMFKSNSWPLPTSLAPFRRLLSIHPST